jgi:hypothetical protein
VNEEKILARYLENRDRMDDGDLIPMYSKGRLSDLITWRTGGFASHLGMVIRFPGLVPLDGEYCNDSVFVIESTMLSTLRDAFDGKIRRGVQIHWLSKRLLALDGMAWWMPLRRPFNEEERIAWRKWVRRQHINEVDYDTVQALGAGLDFFDKLFETKEDLSKLFCSEYATASYQVCKRLPDYINPSEQTPWNMVSGHYQVGTSLKDIPVHAAVPTLIKE